MTGRGPRTSSLALTALVLAGCGESAPPPSAPGVGKVLAALLAAADAERAPWRCAALDTPAVADAQITTGERRWS